MLRSIPTRRIGALRDVVLYRAILGLTPPWTLANGAPDGRKKTTIRSCQVESAATRKPEEPELIPSAPEPMLLSLHSRGSRSMPIDIALTALAMPITELPAIARE